jgi:hypothetical protein
MFRERERIMKAQNIMKSLVIAIILIAGAAQVSAVTYQTKYKGSMYNVQSPTSYGAAPAATFQSTSTYASPEWAEESTLNSDGTVNEGAYMSGPRRLGEVPSPGGTQPGTPDKPNPENQQPLGDALIPLALLACAYAIYKVSRRRKEA